MPHSPSLENFTLIAHRGSSYDAPENTFEAFDLALANGFDNVETDVQLSSDGRAVLIHDDKLDRTTDGSGVVTETGIARIKSLNAGMWFEGPEDSVGLKGPLVYSDAFVPTLDEFCERYAGKLHVHLELKSTQSELAEISKKSLERWDWLDQHTGDSIAPGVTISSFHYEQLERSVQVMPSIAHGWLIQEINDETISKAEQLKLSGIYPRADLVSPEQISQLTAAGFTVRTWGIGNSRENLENAYKSGAVGTTVDWPSQAKDHLESLK